MSDDAVSGTRERSVAELTEQRDKCWRAIVKMAGAAGPAWTPRWVLDLIDDDGNLPDDPWSRRAVAEAEGGAG